MNINEDKFANKSAEEIISDMLTQHKNNSKEALEHIQDILNDDGLTLSKDAKDNLQKAATMLSDKGLKEGWFSKPLPKEAVVFEVYLPFKKEPAQFQIPPVSSLDDPLVKNTIQKIRKKHPHSTIYIKSKLGNKTIREEKEEPSLFAKAAKGILKSDLAKNLGAIGLTALTGGALTPILTQPVATGALNATAKKFENTNTSYKVNLYNESGTYSCYAGTLPIALTLVEKANGYSKADILFNEAVICSYDNTLKEWATSSTSNSLKEDIYDDEDITSKAYVDLKKDITDLDERTKLILCHLNPNLIDKRKPKWHNTLLDAPKLVNVDTDTKGEVYIVLDGIENEVNHENPDQTEITIREKVPVGFTDSGFVYKNGDSYVITVKQFKDILNDPENAEIREKFEKSKEAAILNDDLANYFLEFDKLAKETIDARYPDWEQSHWDEYNLDMYDLPERAKIYQAWKDTNRTNMYQQARELTPEEVNKQFGLPKLKKILNAQPAGKKVITAYDRTRSALPTEEQTKLDTSLLDLLTNTDEVEDTDIKQLIGYYGAKNQLNQLSGNKLNTIENNLPEEYKAQFNDAIKDLLISKYVDPKSGLPLVIKKPREAFKDVMDLVKQYNSSTKTSKWAASVNSNNDVRVLAKQIINNINEINTVNPEMASALKGKFIGAKNNWQKQQIVGEELLNKLSEFVTYSDQVKNDAFDRIDQMDVINTKYSDPAQADQRNAELDAIRNKPMLNTDAENAHAAWLAQVKAIENPDSNSQTDKSYYTAITNKISRLLKNDPQAAKGYGDAFRKLLKDLEAKELSEEEIALQLAKFLSVMKDETGAPGTVSKTLASVL